jgi:chromosome segregation ATPase
MTRLESLNLETCELHAAMASLHAEVSCLQSELDTEKEKETEILRQRKELINRLEVKENDILKIKNDKNNLETKLYELEKKFNDQNDRNRFIEQESTTKVDILSRERDNVQGSLAKMSYKIKQQSLSLQEQNNLLNRMRADLKLTLEGKEVSEIRAETAEKSLAELKLLASSVEEDKIHNKLLYQHSHQENAELNSNLTQLKEKNSNLQSENRKVLLRIDHIEKEKVDISISLTNKLRDLDVAHKNNELNQITIEELRAKLDNERSVKDHTLELNGSMESELDRLRSDNREHQENIDSFSRQIREADRMREQVLTNNITII